MHATSWCRDWVRLASDHFDLCELGVFRGSIEEIRCKTNDSSFRLLKLACKLLFLVLKSFGGFEEDFFIGFPGEYRVVASTKKPLECREFPRSPIRK